MMAGHAQIRWYGREAVSKIRDGIADQLVAIGNDEVKEIQQSISTQGPPHSSPGSSPNKITGELVNSIYSEVRQEGDDVVLRIGSTSDHAVPLELGTRNMAPRPFLLPGMYRAGQKTKRIRIR